MTGMDKNWFKDSPILPSTGLLNANETVNISIPLKEARSTLKKFDDKKIKQIATELHGYLIEEAGLDKILNEQVKFDLSNPKSVKARIKKLNAGVRSENLFSLLTSSKLKFKNYSHQELYAIVFLYSAFNGRTNEAINSGFLLMMLEGAKLNITNKSYFEKISEYAPLVSAAKEMKSKGGRITAQEKKRNAILDARKIHKEVDRLIKSGKEKTGIASIVITRTGFSKTKIYTALKTHSSNLWK